MSGVAWSTGTWVSIAWTAVVVLYAWLATAWTGSDPGWYDGLARPAFQPPDWVFGVMWPLNFVALLVVGWALPAAAGGRALPPLAVLAVSVAAALTWAWLFYVPPHRLVAAAVGLAAAALLTWLLVALAARLVPWTGLVLVPYALWLTVATTLAVEYARTG